ncbi:VPLPA-CTERM sorting domain-containing protein [Puniceibacterium sp. IMCC21224]|uniref:VPLPA-CTERM sorting domain-containing protein n=1 Tax=Puniceibacterium sp. IMCC21224 TaxID=1618204 RepID=UPI00064D92FA|nr:VPLPA-CTERM sorting domain-containing protein [Puniceibacterium sp. IMCC21224]KMK64186.1 hypothetical protein IMCC21224_15164 [Puniceibacterium sp. IMCC21224]KMK65260.1 hypothetical protein IMCC21224_1191 [Puniceibacterium sp. IMCC21224]
MNTFTRFFATAFVAFAGSFSAAHAATLDFSASGSCAGGPGVTFAILTNSNCFLAPTPNNTNGLSLLSNTSSSSRVRADFTDLASFVSVDLGDFGSDTDTVFISAYDSIGTLLGTQSASIVGRAMKTVSVASADISYAIFGSSFDVGFIAADNFKFTTQVSAVPLPAGGALLLTGLGAFALARRRKS